MKNTFLDIFKDSLEFKNITYLQDIVESNYQNAQEIIEELNTFDQYSKLFSEYKPETPNKFFSGPFITYILNDVTQFISTFLSISQNNNKKEISIQGLMFSYKLSDYYQYFPLLQETIDISRLFKMYSMEIPKSSAGLSIGELSEKQNINYMLQKIVKNIQNLLPIAEIVTNQMKKYFADEIKAQNTKANEKQISFDEANEVLKNTSQDSLELTLPELEEMFKPEIKTTTNAFDIEIETKEEEVKEEVKEKEKDVEEVVVEKEDKEKPVVLDIQFPPSYDGFLKVPFQFVPFLANDVESDIKSFDDIPGYIITPPIEGFEDEYEEKEFPHFDDVHFDVQLERKPLKFTAMIESEMPPKNVSQINIPPPSYAQQPVFDQTPKITRRSSQPNNALLGLPPPDSPIRRGSSPKFSILQPPEPPINHQRNKSQMPSPLFDDGENLPLFNKRSSPLRKSDDLFGARAPTPPSEFDDSPQNPIFDFGGLNNKTKNDEKVSKFDFSSAFSDFGSGNSNKGNTEGKVSKFDFGSGFSDFGSGNSNDKGNTGGKVSKFDFSSGFSDFGHGNSQNKGNNEGKASKFDFGSVFPEFGNNAGGKSTVNFREPLKVPADSPFSKFLMNGNDNSMFLKNGNDNNNGVFFIPPGEDDEYNEYDYDYDYDTFDEDSEGELESDGLPVEVSKDLSLVGIVQEYLHCLKDDLNIIRTSLQDYSPDEDNSYSIQKALDTSLRVETSVENIENSAE
ncbi:hypothetical protein GPJ56_003555 [Histomonas meleagridis]|uniref:uncharacterized protein n=1 Tax=Histomonas meleagridis TaxID=135588 RepID=UPI003559B6BD|nr:hypothetical protein GPJ56_003555 [Histomonas meleagridis]KAH0806441.1 hypothetical protein GO595_000816 [Histomonas meleagridis]